MTDHVDLDKLRELAEKASWPRTDPGAIDNYGSLVIDNHLLVEILDERAEALARIAKVEALHRPDSIMVGMCAECSDFGTDEAPEWSSVAYPCPTVRALTEGENDAAV